MYLPSCFPIPDANTTNTLFSSYHCFTSLARTPECALQALVHFIIFTTTIITLAFSLHKMKTKHIQQVSNCIQSTGGWFRFPANFTLDRMTSQTSGQAVKYNLKWRPAMLNLGLIAVESDVLCKIKPRTVTQLSVIFLLASF